MKEFQNERYQIQKQIGEGNFGSVYKAFDVKSQKYVAIKIEKSKKLSQIHTEIQVLSSLNGESGFPYLIDSGRLENNLSYIVMPLLGKSLVQAYDFLIKSVPKSKVFEIFADCVKRVQSLHLKFFVHRDIKPHQFLVSQANQVSLIDFGLAKRFMNPKLMTHHPYNDSSFFVGTQIFASLNTHMGIQQSRRDDLESLCYMFSYLIQQGLPWVNINNKKKCADNKRIMRLKTSVKPSQLFSSESLITMLLYIKNLRYEENPDYNYLLRLLEKEKKNEINILMISRNHSLVNSRRVRQSKKGSSKKKKFSKSSYATLNQSNVEFFGGNDETEVGDWPEFKNRQILSNTINSYK